MIPPSRRLPSLRPVRHLLSLGLTLALVFLAVPAAGQKTSTPAFEDLIEVSEVILDVLVTDTRGQVILGLDEEDFLVEENGETMPLTGVSFYSNRFEIRDDDLSRVNKPAKNEVLADRYFIFFFHDQLRRGGTVTPLVREQFDAARKVERFIKEEMLPGDFIAIASYDLELKIHQDFTRERAKLLRAVKRAVQGKDPDNAWSSRRIEVPEGDPTLYDHLPEGDELRDRTTRIEDGLRLLAEATRDILGRKNLILFSNGFGRTDTPATQNAALPDERYYPPLREALNDNNVAVYPIDLTPAGTTSIQAGVLTELASATGGEYYGTLNNYLVPLRQIADEANGYYLLTYQTEHPAGESGYREVTISTPNPEFRVKVRQGYRYGTEPEG